MTLRRRPVAEAAQGADVGGAGSVGPPRKSGDLAENFVEPEGGGEAPRSIGLRSLRSDEGGSEPVAEAEAGHEASGEAPGEANGEANDEPGDVLTSAPPVATPTPQMLELLAACGGAGSRLSKAVETIEGKLPGWLDVRVVRAIAGSHAVGLLPNKPRNAWPHKGSFHHGVPEVNDCLRFANAVARQTGCTDPRLMEAAFFIGWQRWHRSDLVKVATQLGVDPYPYPANRAAKEFQPLGADPNADPGYLKLALRLFTAVRIFPMSESHKGEVELRELAGDVELVLERVSTAVREHGRNILNAGNPDGAKIRAKGQASFLPATLSSRLGTLSQWNVLSQHVDRVFGQRLRDPEQQTPAMLEAIRAEVEGQARAWGSALVDGLSFYRDKMARNGEEFPAEVKFFGQQVNKLQALIDAIPEQCAGLAKSNWIWQEVDGLLATLAARRGKETSGAVAVEAVDPSAQMAQALALLREGRTAEAEALLAKGVGLAGSN